MEYHAQLAIEQLEAANQRVHKPTPRSSGMPSGGMLCMIVRYLCTSTVAACLAGQSDDGSGLIRRASDPDIVRPEADLRNIQQAEREVETASEDSGSPASGMGPASTDGSEGARRQLPWLTEWRLRSALSSVDRYQVLMRLLTGVIPKTVTLHPNALSSHKPLCKSS